MIKYLITFLLCGISLSLIAQKSSFDFHFEQYMALKNDHGPNDSIAREHLNRSFDLVDSSILDIRFGDIYFEKGKDVYQFGENEKALNLFFKAMRQFGALADSCKYKKALYNIGAVLSTLGDSHSALKYYQDYAGIKACPLDSNSISLYHYNLALLFQDLELHHDAKGQFQFVIDLDNHSERGNFFSLASQLAMSAYNYLDGNVQEAIARHKTILYDSVISFFESDLYFYGYSQLGEYHLEISEFDSAKKYYQMAAKISDSLQYREFVLDNLLHCADLALKQNRLDDALMYSDSALRSAQAFNYSWGEIDALTRLNKIYVRKGDWKSAYEHNILLTNIKDSLLVEKTKFDYLVGEIEDTHQTNLLLDRRFKSAKIQVAERTKALLVFGLLLAIMGVLLAIVIGQRKKLGVLNHTLTERNTQKDKIIATLSHDVRIPLVGLEGLIELLKMDIVSEEEKGKALQSLEVSLANLKLNVDALLSWSLSQLKGGEPKMEHISVTEMFNQARSFMETKLISKQIDLTTEITPPDLHLFADKGHIQVVIRNLFSNSIRFSKPRGKIIFSAKADDQSVYITVRDFGAGIATEDFNYILGDKVYTKSRDNDGSGMGLRLVKEYVLLNKGVISFESKLNKGTTFKMVFPR